MWGFPGILVVLCGFSSLWWPFGWNWSYLGFLGIIWRTYGSKCRGEGGGIFPTLCVECCLVQVCNSVNALCPLMFTSRGQWKQRAGTVVSKAIYWDISTGNHCGQYLIGIVSPWYLLHVQLRRGSFIFSQKLRPVENRAFRGAFQWTVRQSSSEFVLQLIKKCKHISCACSNIR